MHAALVGTLSIVTACGGGSTVDLSPGRLAVDDIAQLGSVDCGASSIPVTATLHNDLPSSVVVWSVTPEGPFVLDGPTQGSLPAFASASVPFHAVVPKTSVAGIPLKGALRFTTNDPKAPEVVVPLTVLPHGATIRTPTFPIELGDVPLTATSPEVDVTLTNDGDADAALAVGAPNEPQFTITAQPNSIARAKDGVIRATFTSAKLGVQSAVVPIVVQGAYCGAPPTLMLRAKGTNGKALTSPGSLDFGLVDCGTTALAKVVSVQNVGDASFDVDAALTVGKDFTVSPAHTTVAPLATVQVTVTPKAVPQTSAVTIDLYGDTLTLTTTSAGDSPHVIPIHETAHGAILSATIPQTPMRSLVDSVKTLSVTITNSGNASASGTVTTANAALALQAFSVTAGSTSPGTLELRADPDKLGVDDLETLSWNMQGPVCGVGPTSGTVRAYDTVLDFNSPEWTACTIGHSHRVYCWGNSTMNYNPLPFDPGVYLTPKLVPGQLADQVGVSGWGTWLWSAGGPIRQLTRTNGVTTITTIPFGGPFSRIYKVDAPGNYAWCGLTPLDSVTCFGANASGQFADSSECSFSAIPTAHAFDSIAPVDAFSLQNEHYYAIKGGVVWGSDSCTNGNPRLALPPKPIGLSNVVQVAGTNGRSCARRANGTITCWNPAIAPFTFDELLGVSDANGIVVRELNGFVLRQNGNIHRWELFSPTPPLTFVPGLTNPTRLFPAFLSVCGTDPGSALYCAEVVNNLFQFVPVPGFDGP